MSDDLSMMTATALNALYSKKKVSPVEVCQSIFKKIKQVNTEINAFQYLDEESALETAKASENRWQKEVPWGIADGIPVTIKDNILTQGWPSLSGSKLVEPNQDWDEDAPAVARFREQGAVLLGKTTMPEFAWKVTTDSPLFGITRNPWNTAHTPGGSSGGAAAAVASGMGTLALASDGGGSIRVPASHCNLVGLKATHGRIADYPPSRFGTNSNIGPIAKTVADIALMMNVISQGDSRDWYNLPENNINYLAEIKGNIKNIRVAYSYDLGLSAFFTLDQQVLQLFQASVEKFQILGAKVEEVKWENNFFKEGEEAYGILRFAMLNSLISNFTSAQQSLMDPALLKAAHAQPPITLANYLAAEQGRRLFGSQLNQFFSKYDFLITPTIHCLPGVVENPAPEPYLTMCFNASRHPAISVPCGFSKTGLPVGLQIISGHYKDAFLLKVAHAFEQLG
jgi:aspartyl-tRNA(Asn)/glutamyl-tRNA(Gln) amidotransferase subunit A